jgi:hypothetical protein
MSGKTLILLCTGLMLFAGCSTVVKTDIRHDQQTNFADYRTFAFLDQSGKPARLNDPFITMPEARDSIRQMIESHLLERGFKRERINDADFLVAIHAGTDDLLNAEMKHWRYSFARHWHFADDISYPAGSLIIDFFDEEDNLVFWRGSAEQVFQSEDLISDKDKLRKAVSTVLDAYPPKRVPIDSSAV